MEKASIKPLMPEKRHPSAARKVILAILLSPGLMADFARFLSFMPLFHFLFKW
jgi:hypothetical protein